MQQAGQVNRHTLDSCRALCKLQASERRTELAELTFLVKDLEKHFDLKVKGIVQPKISLFLFFLSFFLPLNTKEEKKIFKEC